MEFGTGAEGPRWPEVWSRRIESKDGDAIMPLKEPAIPTRVKIVWC